MKKLSLSVIAIGLISVSAFAQNRSRVFDNFDTRSGVQIVIPTVRPMIQTTATANPKKLIKKTAQVKPRMNAAEGLAAKELNKPANYSKMVMATGANMKGFTTGDLTIDSYIINSCRKYNIDPLLIYSQMHQESSFKLRATSNKGASGLMQLMPGTARRFGVSDIYNPQQNIEAGVRYMSWLLNTFGGDVGLALAGYNAGEGAVMKYGNQIPPYRETQEYVRRITTRYSSITNPMIAKNVRRVSSEQAAKLEAKISAPLELYETGAVTIKLPDGRMRLVNR